jgi:hypothetical protein
MSGTKKITVWIQWSDEDGAFIGYCPEFFPYRAVCHGHTEAKTSRSLLDWSGKNWKSAESCLIDSENSEKVRLPDREN